ncbi:hypothetical protein KKF91_06790 [Myxococcota bacterium]|nr:hypothetical protein [Myxococcota bacterium]MBU1430262.1 hypothetical protein [Myxococcota bacterium]MBU1897183.1 hypothetical protein [Myxococcota bacterium]
MLNALILLLVEVISPIDAVLPHVRALPEAQRLNALLPLLKSRPELSKEAEALALTPQQKAAVAAVLLSPVVPKPPSLPGWAAALAPDPQALKNAALDERLLLVEAYHRRGERAAAIKALEATRTEAWDDIWLDWALDLGAWSVAVRRVDAHKELDAAARIDALKRVAERIMEVGAWAALGEVTKAISLTEHGESEDVAWAEEWGEEAAPPEDVQARQENLDELIREALEALATQCAARQPKRAVEIIGLISGEDEVGAEAKRGLVSELLEANHLKIALALAKDIPDPLPPALSGCEGDECGGTLEPTLIGSEARFEVLQAALDALDVDMAWAALEVIHTPGGGEFETRCLDALGAFLPLAIQRDELPRLQRYASRLLRAEADVWREDVIQALIDADQIAPALAMLPSVEGAPRRLALLSALALRMEGLGLGLTPEQVKGLVAP